MTVVFDGSAQQEPAPPGLYILHKRPLSILERFCTLWSGTTIPGCAGVNVRVLGLANAVERYCMMEVMSYGPEESKYVMISKNSLFGQHPAGTRLSQHVAPAGIVPHSGSRF